MSVLNSQRNMDALNPIYFFSGFFILFFREGISFTFRNPNSLEILQTLVDSLLAVDLDQFNSKHTALLIQLLTPNSLVIRTPGSKSLETLSIRLLETRPLTL